MKRKREPISIAKLEEVLLHLEVLVPGLGRLGSAMNEVSYTKACELVLDYVMWSRIGRRLPYIRRVLSDEFSRAASARQIRQHEKRCDQIIKWHYDKTCKNRIERRKRPIIKRGGWASNRLNLAQIRAAKLNAAHVKGKSLPAVKVVKRSQLSKQGSMKKTIAESGGKHARQRLSVLKKGSSKSATRPIKPIKQMGNRRRGTGVRPA